jgi:hypothetical protein
VICVAPYDSARPGASTENVLIRPPLDTRVPRAGTASPRNDGARRLDCDSRRAVGPTKTIRGVYMTQLNRLQRLAALSAFREWSF